MNLTPFEWLAEQINGITLTNLKDIPEKIQYGAMLYKRGVFADVPESFNFIIEQEKHAIKDVSKLSKHYNSDVEIFYSDYVLLPKSGSKYYDTCCTFYIAAKFKNQKTPNIVFNISQTDDPKYYC